jgi:hypothetical protein
MERETHRSSVSPQAGERWAATGENWRLRRRRTGFSDEGIDRSSRAGVGT